MRCFDVFNGDADGIISLVMLRRDDPREAELVTGRKRDINLLSRVDAGAGDAVTVLDISMKSNASDLRRILDAGAEVFYVDHHNAGDIPDAPNLNVVINTAPEVCTAVLVDNILEGRYREWAVTAAFGDNFPAMAKRLSAGRNFTLETLARLGTLINYNGYGGSLDDLLYHPAELYKALAPYDTPTAFLSERYDIFQSLTDCFASDMTVVSEAKILDETPSGLIQILPDMAASRRASGTYGNDLAQAHPERAHAILTEQMGGYLVSIRAPITSRKGADTLAMQFETGGGRAAAAGINQLSGADLSRFVDAFRAAFP